MADLKALAEQIVGLTLLQAQELKTILKDEYGIEPAAGGAVMVAGPAAGGAAAAAGGGSCGGSVCDARCDAVFSVKTGFCHSKYSTSL